MAYGCGDLPQGGISQATYFNWRKKYAGLLPDEMRRLKALEDENSRLKKIVADLSRAALSLVPRLSKTHASVAGQTPVAMRHRLCNCIGGWRFSAGQIWV